MNSVRSSWLEIMALLLLSCEALDKLNFRPSFFICEMEIIVPTFQDLYEDYESLHQAPPARQATSTTEAVLIQLPRVPVVVSRSPRAQEPSRCLWGRRRSAAGLLAGMRAEPGFQGGPSRPHLTRTR